MKISNDAWRLSDATRKACASIGLVCCAAGLWLEYRPPMRKTTEINQSPPSPTRTERTVESPAESETAHVTIFIAGVALILFGANGVRFFTLKTSLGEVGANVPGDRADVENKASDTTPADAADAAIDRFLNLSSWAGLKLLKACSEAAAKKRPLDLRTLGKVGNEEVSYDYLYGYLIASISAGAVSGIADPGVGFLVNASVHPIVRQKIDGYIAGNISVNPGQSDWKRSDLERLNAFLVTL